MSIYRRESKARNGWNNGDIDVAFQLFESGMVGAEVMPPGTIP